MVYSQNVVLVRIAKAIGSNEGDLHVDHQNSYSSEVHHQPAIQVIFDRRSCRAASNPPALLVMAT